MIRTGICSEGSSRSISAKPSIGSPMPAAASARRESSSANGSRTAAITSSVSFASSARPSPMAASRPAGLVSCSRSSGSLHALMNAITASENCG